jgi:N-acetylmuramoyl-L-alanine amidase
MLVHTVVQGDCLSSIAKKYGFSNWRTIYDDAHNAAFRQKRPNPNIIYPGDEIFIPDRQTREESRSSDSKHRFQVKRERTLLRLFILDAEGKPVRRKRYRLVVGDQTFEDKTKSGGLIEHEVPADAESGLLTVWLDDAAQPCTWEVQIGHLDPVEEITGLQARLGNLAFYSGRVDGYLGPHTKAAIRAFQEKYGLPVDGAAGPDTQAKLKDVHGC